MIKIMWGAALALSAMGISACSDAHTGDGDDAGITVRDDVGPHSVNVGTDGGGGVTILVDGAIALPDGAIVDRDGSVIVTRDAGATTHVDDAATIIEDAGPVVAAHVGHPCESDVDCPGLFCSSGSSGLGYCSWLCGGGMVCPSGSVCHSFTPGAVGYCMEQCDPMAAGSCATGFVCQGGIAEVPVCYPGCTSDADCSGGARCGDGASGARSCYTPGATAGGTCSANSDCPQGGYCIDEASWGAPHGLCVTFCDLATHAGCDTGTTCVPWGFDASYGSCVPTCDASTPCRSGYECVSTGASMPSACVARCTSDADCTAPHGCNFVTGRCG